MVHHHVSKRQTKLLELFGISTSEKRHTTQEVICKNHTNYCDGFYVFAILGLSVISTSIITLVPQHNHIEFPYKWYELVFICPYLGVLLTSIMIQDCYFYFKAKSMVSVTSFLRVFMGGSLAGCTSLCLLLSIWTIGFDFNLPVPFTGALWWPMSGVFTMFLWFEFPNKLRKNQHCRKKIMSFITVLTLIFWTIAQYDFLAFIVISSWPSDTQWILAIVLPLLRDINIWVLTNRVSKAMPWNFEAARLGTITTVRSINTIYVAIILTNVTAITLYSILGIEFLLHFYSCYKIIKLQGQIEANGFEDEERKEKIKEAVLDLVLSETIEVVASLAYSVTLAAAYYGPNSGVLGNIGNSYWAYKEVQNIENSLTIVFQIALADFGIGIICGLLLWNFGRINIFREFCTMMKTYWLAIALRISFIMTKVKSEFT